MLSIFKVLPIMNTYRLKNQICLNSLLLNLLIWIEKSYFFSYNICRIGSLLAFSYLTILAHVAFSFCNVKSAKLQGYNSNKLKKAKLFNVKTDTRRWNLYMSYAVHLSFFITLFSEKLKHTYKANRMKKDLIWNLTFPSPFVPFLIS